MPLCYVVPGILSSELSWNGLFPGKIWIDYANLALGDFGLLELDPNGIGSPQGFTGQMVAGPPIPDVYDDGVRVLGDQLAPHGYTVVPFGYDWRVKIEQSATQLAFRIALDVKPTDPPCAIVAHSMGGLVARYAWRVLGNLGLQSLVRRIVTLGTPHQGSYAAALLLAGKFAAQTALSMASIITFGASIPAKNPFKAAYSVDGIARICATWPAAYELMPMLGGTEAAVDPQRRVLYQDGTWSTVPPSGSRWLPWARDVFQPLMISDPSTMPPPSVLTTFAGIGFPTMVALVPGGGITSYPRDAVNSDDGDLFLGRGSALVPMSRQDTGYVSHQGMFSALANTGDLARYVLDDSSPTPAPPTGITSRPSVGPPYSVLPPASGVYSTAGGDC